MSYSLRLLGPPAVWAAEEWQLLPVQKPTLLLLYLATRGVWVERFELCALFFTEGSLEAGRLSLRQLISRARRMEWASLLEVEGDRLRFRVSTDLSQFREHLEGQRWNDALEMELRGNLLEGLSAPLQFLNWLEAERFELEEQSQEAFLRQAMLLYDAQRFERSMKTLEPLLTTAGIKVRQDLLCLYLKSALKCGQSEAALERFTAYRTHLLEEYQALPGEDVLALVRCLEQGWPLGRTQTGGQRGLGTGSTPLLGRDSVLADCMAALEFPHRFLCLWGSAGVGKTRLALELSLRLEQQGKRVCYVDASHPPQQESALWTLTADALNLPLERQTLNRTEMDQTEVIEALNLKNALLILDHSTNAESFLAPLLERCPALQIMVVGNELQQDADFALELSGLTGSAALSLLEPKKYQSSRAGLSLEQKNSLEAGTEAYPALVLELCGSLGLSLPESKEATSLEVFFATVWTHLNEGEREALEVLSHFQEGCSSETAAALGVSKSVQQRLERHSLLRVRGGGWVQLHRSLSSWTLNSVRNSSARERGAETNHTLERQHFFHFARKIGGQESDLGGSQTWQQLAALDAEQVSLRRALRWGLHNAREREVERAFEGFVFGYTFYGLLEGGPESLIQTAPRQIKDLLEAEDSSSLSTEARVSLERMRLRLGLFEAGLTPLNGGNSRVRRVAQCLLELNAHRDAALAWGFLALLEWEGNPSAALEQSASLAARPLPVLEGTFAQQTLTLSGWLEALPSASSEPRFKSWTRYLVQLTHGHLAQREGAFTAAREAFGFALEQAHTLEHPGALAWAQLHSGKAYLLEHNWNEAVGCLGLALEAGRKLVAPYLTLEALEGLVDAHTFRPLAPVQARQVASELERQMVWPLRSAAFYSKASNLLERMKVGVEG